MRIQFATAAAVALAAPALASFDGNLNYGSPSRRHDGLGINLGKISKRMLTKRASSCNNETLNFTHGVASGDPWPGSVILWTRVSPEMKNSNSNVTVSGTAPLYDHDNERYVKISKHPICVDWAVSTQESMDAPVSTGKAYTTSDVDFTIKVEATGLSPFTTYYYQFTVCGTSNKSPLGRTKTAPNEDDDVTAIKMAVFSCSNYPNGYFNAYGNSARKDNMDYVIHLGDYIYETSRGTPGKDPRATDPQREIVTLYDYRTRIAQYRTDPDLALSHQQHAWIPTWDDHETFNNAYRDGSSAMNNTEQTFNKYNGITVDQRKMHAARAYFEWMPLRQVDMDDNLRIWRNFKLGKLVDLTMLDTRNYDRSITDLSWNGDYIRKIADDTGRTLMGSHQENWFYRTLSESKQRGATWRIVGNQIVFSRIDQNGWREADAPFYSADAWTGYMANRNRTFQSIMDNDIPNVVFLAGDSHQSWVSDLIWDEHHEYDPQTGKGAHGVEFAVTAVSSGGPNLKVIEDANNRSSRIFGNNPELMWQEGYYRGYLELHVTPEKLDARFFGCPSVATRNAWEVPLANFTVIAGENRLARPVAGGRVEAGWLAADQGEVVGTNLTFDTEKDTWDIVSPPGMFIQY